MTSFQVLAKDASGFWAEHSKRDAHNAETAVKIAYLKAPDSGIVAMVAVPARSWKPTLIRTETVTKVVLGAEPKSEPHPGDQAA